MRFFSVCFLVFFLFSVSISAQEKKTTEIEFPLKEIQSKKAKSDLVIGDVLGSSTESGGAARFTIHLSSKPFDTVDVHIASKNVKEGVVDPKSIAFTPENWSIPQTVKITGQDDLIMDGNQTYIIEISVSSERDFDYSKTPLKQIVLENVDNDQAGFSIGKISGSTTEDGGRAFFKIRLNSQPTHAVTIPIKSSDISEGKVQSEKIHFTKENWDQFQVVSVTGQNDFVVDGDITYHVLLTTMISDDLRYNGLTPGKITVVNLDNDTAAIITTDIKGNTTENNGNVDFAVGLTSEPTAQVLIQVTSTDTSEGTVDPSTLLFTAENWKKRQTVRIFGVNDPVDDENQPYEIVLSPLGSKDSVYAALRPVGLNVINEDDDTADILIRMITARTAESGEEGKFAIKLNTKPTAEVKLRLESDNPAEGRLLLKDFTFSPEDWYQEKTVTVIGQNDNLADGDKEYLIIIHPAISQDPKYDKLDPRDVKLTNLDDENVGVAFGPISGPTTEKNGSASFTVRLNSKPSADVVFDFTSSDEKEGVVDTPKLVFHADNWDSFQTVSVTGQPDGVVDGNQTYSVISNITSQDTAFAAHIPEPVSVINNDINTYAVIIDQGAGDTSESGKGVSISFKLNSKPESDVTINLDSSAPTEGQPTPRQLVFNGANWNHPQVISITGVNDDVKDGDQSYQLK
ncbi:hypothetical protein KKA14_09200, partial [bacterium]|nr:hypothetical protein [bacterium]